jgi:hypothetical protein
MGRSVVELVGIPSIWIMAIVVRGHGTEVGTVFEG